jgi:hypothetical protein
MASNKPIVYGNCFWSGYKCDDQLFPSFYVSDQQIFCDIDFILFKDNPISNTQ